MAKRISNWTPTSNKRKREPEENFSMHQNSMESVFNFSSSYPQSLFEDFMEIFTKMPVPNAQLPSYVPRLPKITIHKDGKTIILPNPNKRLMQQKTSYDNKLNTQKSVQNSSPPTFYQDDPKFQQNFQTPNKESVNREDSKSQKDLQTPSPPSFYREREGPNYLKNLKTPSLPSFDRGASKLQRHLETPSPPSYYQEDTKFYHDSPSRNQRSEASVTSESNNGFDGFQSEIVPESFCATDEQTCASLIMAGMLSPEPELKLKRRFVGTLSNMHYPRNKPDSEDEDDEEKRLTAEYYVTYNPILRRELRAKLINLRRSKRIAKRIEGLREVLTNGSLDELDYYKMTVVLTMKFGCSDTNLRGAINLWNRNFGLKIPYLSNRKKEVVPKSTSFKELSILHAEKPPIYSYNHKKINYKNYVSNSNAVVSLKDLSDDQYNLLPEELNDRIISFKLAYYEFAIQNLRYCNKYFQLNYSFHENKSRLRADYGEDEAANKIRIKNNIASRRSRHRKKHQIFTLFNAVDFDYIMIETLEKAIESATRSINDLEQRVADPALISKYRSLCNL